MELLKEDLKDMGNTAYEGENDNLVIVSDGRCLGIERIIIRNLLPLFGDFSIIDENEVQNIDGTCDWEFVTNLPWEVYCKL